MDAAKNDSIPHTREYRLAFSRTVWTEDSLFQSDLRIYDYMKEPVDVFYQFELLNSAMEKIHLMIFLVLLHICEVLACQILVPLVLTKLLSDKDRPSLGEFDFSATRNL